MKETTMSKHPNQQPIISRRTFSAAAFGVTLLGVASACGNPDAAGKDVTKGSGGGSGDTLVVYDGGGSWGEAQRKAFFEPFQRDTGIKVIPTPAGGQPKLRSAIMNGNPGMDVIDVGGGNVVQWEDQGLMQKIDFASWKNPGLREKFEPFKATDYRVPSIIFAVQMAYDKAAMRREPRSWADFWDVSGFPGPRSLKVGDAPGGSIYEIALLADGVKPEDLYPLDIDRAFRKLTELRPHILKFWGSGAESVQLLIDKQVTGVAAWNGRIQDAVDKGASNVQSSWDQAVLQVDYWAIPKGAKNVAGAQKFIEYVIQPERQAEFAKLITYAPTLPEAYDHIPEERRQLLATAPAFKSQVVNFSPEFWGSKNASGKIKSEEIGERWQKWLAG
jgi:putative spermidine/putrescine transport system substrate-binding protein